MNLFYVAIEQSDSQLEVELKKADVVCIVYAVDDEDTLDSGIVWQRVRSQNYKWESFEMSIL